MIYYRYKNKTLFSLKDEYSFRKISREEALDHCHELFFLTKLPSKSSKRSYAISDVSDLFIETESLELLKSSNEKIDDDKIMCLIKQREIKAVNTEYNDYENDFAFGEGGKKRVNILALGDVGSALLIGLKLIGGNCIDTIGIYDRSKEKIKRWELEMNQVSYPIEYSSLPMVKGIDKDELFDCDMFVFCASKGVPAVGSDVKDVRMAQFTENSHLIKEYAAIASRKQFSGIFAVVSDPVDLLCKTVLDESCGVLLPEQIKGYGLGVMNARAAYYAKKHDRFRQYLTEGRAFGPHGNDLVIADSIENYNDELSKELTEMVVKANLEIRGTGFKPFVAPALSSGAISIVHTLEEKWHYSSNYIGGVYMGARNRNTKAGLEIEKINMPKILFDRINVTYERLKLNNQ